ncbi:cora-like Mg2+ transporter [Plectosphaerella cucumerina]|uniref:Cora-like Mg2+ transporter n=1 Tax=Plectosphaerella cucumerina TaxID=40658 RepID=A0A8K0X5X8_9PEZI|nr:cora-like Mg2+ transporter [Plectosphaerella cucumerina]
MTSNPFQPLANAAQSPLRPARPDLVAPAASSTAPPGSDRAPSQVSSTKSKKKKSGHKKRRGRRKSFAILPEESHDEAAEPERTPQRPELYLQTSGNFSNTSIDSQTLLDHRDQQPMRIRRNSTLAALGSSLSAAPQVGSRLRSVFGHAPDSGDDDQQSEDEGAPLLSRSAQRTATAPLLGYGSSQPRLSRRGSSRSSRTKRQNAFSSSAYNNVNYPPSMPGSPRLGGPSGMDLMFQDVMIDDMHRSPHGSYHDHHSDHEDRSETSPGMTRRKTIPNALSAEADVCFPTGVSELGEEEDHIQASEFRRRPKRRRKPWPDLSILDEWSRMEKEDRSDERRVKRITEPQLINGRLRTVHRGWMRTEEDAPYRFTYFNEEFQSTIHSQTISELVQAGGNFQELFIPEPRILSDSSSDDETDAEDVSPLGSTLHHESTNGQNGVSALSTRQSSVVHPPVAADEAVPRESQPSPDKDRVTGEKNSKGSSRTGSGVPTPTRVVSPPPRTATQESAPPPEKPPKQPRYGERPVWWLDVLCPTEAEMKVLSKAFGIHPLTAEDIMVQEAREKVELFRHYYFVNYRSFDQDSQSEDYLEPVNMYVVVFREGVLSFHFSMTPHPANVRRRIRHLKDYLIVNPDWISYAIIDDITDVFGPLIQSIEDEVDDIDDAILKLHSSSEERIKDGVPYSEKESDDGTVVGSGGDMLRRVGDCRKRVMSLYRLLGNKADVIKGFAKRCNERWDVAPRSDIGLYLGDIQDHIVTMTSNLSHYEKILARSHGNYLAQINIRMNERSEQTADVLGKLTVLGTIVLPMNIITGLWGMNVWVPGQEYEGDLTWFWCLTAGLLVFGLTCYIIAKRVYKIV